MPILETLRLDCGLEMMEDAEGRVAERVGMSRIAEFQRYGNDYLEYEIKNPRLGQPINQHGH